MYRSILVIKTNPEQAEKLLQLYRDEEILLESLRLTRQVSSDIAVAADGSGEIIVTANWPDAAGYQEWLDHPNRDRLAPEFDEILGGVEVGIGRQYIVDHQVSRD
ncbi:hypothetical protein EII31_05635 [Leucobacter sp. OH2974_COT-288]|uniref:ABM domain-containing protein n=1 Tax=Canibacter oris TaxID=1365628 RepID=A0A840DJA0_9MICO|nr:hypothetical protein [Canibacter oris]MBB4071825.1 hypothetical protein [Canibacter oris]RRD35391.1 hypothetical protein EII31_05635 [Leucobacter sp. OH2974_COT-288]